jgi:hypothetical protein
MEEAFGADGQGFLEQHDALVGLVAEELQGGEAGFVAVMLVSFPVAE